MAAKGKDNQDMHRRRGRKRGRREERKTKPKVE
jgi:hypothetical protein